MLFGAGLLWVCWLLLLGIAFVVVWRGLKQKDSANRVVVILVRNCENLCEEVVRRIFSWPEAIREGVELLVVDDGSTDATGPILECLARTRPGITLVRRNQPSEKDFEWVKDSLSRAWLVFDLREPHALRGRDDRLRKLRLLERAIKIP